LQLIKSMLATKIKATAEPLWQLIKSMVANTKAKAEERLPEIGYDSIKGLS
jgi:hypothetical protein